MVLGGKRLRRSGDNGQAVSPADERMRLATVEAQKRDQDLNKSQPEKSAVSGVVAFTGGITNKIGGAIKGKPKEAPLFLGINGEDED